MTRERKPPGVTQPLIGYIAPDGDANAGYTYAGGDENGSLWVSPYAPRRMTYKDATAWAQEQGGHLPTSKDGEYLDSVKGQLKNLFNLSGDLDSLVWLEKSDNDQKFALCQNLRDGYQFPQYSSRELPALCVRKTSRQTNQFLSFH